MENDERRYAPECYACPIGVVSMRVQEQAPEATEHLIRAGREMLGAVRAVLEGLESFLKTMEERGPGREQAAVRSIPVRREG